MEDFKTVGDIRKKTFYYDGGFKIEEIKSSNGPLRVQSKGIYPSILQRTGTRQLPGIW